MPLAFMRVDVAGRGVGQQSFIPAAKVAQALIYAIAAQAIAGFAAVTCLVLWKR